MKKTMIDPPNGWKYGFPKAMDENATDLKSWLVDNGYPEKDIDFAMQWCRMWEEEVDEDTQNKVQ